ncbi:MAG: hypothetical protein H6765_05660 [Candidatus Peribacteria bacterium]|nr:MAG: hypothetical protein H6765_05660 [Candidatus Peribacteria bacterium]
MPALEHIKESKKRIKGMAYESAVNYLPEQERPSRPTFPLPEDAGLLTRIITTIKQNPGNLEIQLGQQTYKVSENGFHELLGFLR